LIQSSAAAAMDSALDLYGDFSVAGVGLLLALEGFNVAVALTVSVINDPRLFGFASRSSPLALAYRHVALPIGICRIVSQNYP
jgi:hypothetical protein